MTVASASGNAWVDADTHLYEPADAWRDFLDPRHRPDAPALLPMDDGRLFFQYGRRVYPTMPNHPGFGAIYGPGGTATDSVCDPAARLRWMDAHGTETQILYPTLALNGASQVDDPELAGALARAYNRYAAEFASADRRRLVPAIVAPMNHPSVAVQEIAHARNQLGLTLAVSNPTPPGNLAWSDARYDEVWAALQDLDVALTFHELTASAPPYGTGIQRYQGDWAMLYVCTHVVEQVLVLTELILDGTLARFPRLRVSLAESHVSWLEGWLTLLDNQYRTDERGGRDRLELAPSQYFRRQCWIAAFTDDGLLPEALRFGRNVMVCTDWPHPSPEVTERRGLHHLDQRTELPCEERQALLAGNALRFLGAGLAEPGV
jgi:predicted TIM-barrel fold metal-dependent hydrolase